MTAWRNNETRTVKARVPYGVQVEILSLLLYGWLTAETVGGLVLKTSDCNENCNGDRAFSHPPWTTKVDQIRHFDCKSKPFGSGASPPLSTIFCRGMPKVEQQILKICGGEILLRVQDPSPTPYRE
jgi:hypothetical protein